MYTSAAFLPAFFALFRRVSLRFALFALLAFAFGATGLQAYTITLTVSGSFGSATSGTDPLTLAHTPFTVTTSIDTASGPTYPLGASSITISPFGGGPSTLPGSGGTATLSVSGGSTTLALNNVMALGTFSASATVPSSVVGANPGPFPPTSFSNGSVTYSFAGNSTTLSATGTVGGTTTATNISANPTSLSYGYQTGNANPANQSFQVLNATAVPYTATVTPGASWISIASGATGTTTGTVSVAVNPAGLSAGTHSGSITVTSTGAPNTLIVPVTLIVTAPLPTFFVSPTSLTFNFQSGGSTPASQLVSLTSSGSQITFTDSAATTSGGSWLSVSSGSGATPGSVGVSVAPGALTPGTYTGSVTFTPAGAANGPQLVSVTLIVTPPNPMFTAAPSSLTFNYQAGSGTLPSSQPVSLTSSGTAIGFTDSVSTTSGGSWLSVSPGSGSTPGSASVSVTPGSLAAGTYTGTVTFTPSGASNGAQLVGVTLVISPAPSFTASPTSLTFNYQSGAVVPPGQSVSLTSSGSAISFTDSASTVTGGAWLSVSPGGGATPASATVSVTPGSLAPGTYTGTVTFSPAGAANGPQAVGVTLVVTAAPVISASASSVSFTYQIGGATPANQTVNLTGNAPSLPFTDSVSGAPWLTVTPASGATPSTLTFAVNPASLTTPGTFSGTVTIASGSASVPPPINVSITVTAAPTLTLSTNTASFNYQIGSAAPSPQPVTVTTSNPGLAFSAVSDMPWLVVTPAGGTTPGSVSLSLNTAALTTPGTFTGHVTVSASGTSNSPQVIAVTATVAPAPNIQASPSALSFAFQLGGSTPAMQTLNISSSGTALNFTASTITPWLVVTGAGTTPGTVNVSVNTTGLTAQTYNGSVTIAASGSTNGSVTVPVTLTVSSQPTLSASPSVLSFTSTLGGGAPAAQSVAVATTSGAIAFTVAAATATGGPWLSVTPNSGTTPGSFSASVAPGGLAVGTYNGTITITAAGTSNSPLVIGVTYMVTTAPTLTATPGALTFTFQQGGTAPANQALTIGGTAGLTYTASAGTTSGGSWLTLTNPTGTTPGTVTVSVTPGSLTPGSYTGTIATSAPGAATIVTPVTFTVTSAPIFTAAPTTLSFSYTAGSSTIPPGQSVTLTSSGAALSFTAAAATTSGGSWLSVFPPGGSTPGAVTVSVAPASLAAGTYLGTVTLTPTGAGNGPQTVSVALTVTAPAPTFTVAPTSLSFNYQTGAALPATQSVTLSSSGTPIGFTAASVTISGGSWLAAAPSAGTTPATLSVSVTPGSLAPGTYTGTVTVSPTGAANGPQLVAVTLTVTSQPTLTAAPASLSFSFTTGGAAPSSQTVALTSSGSPITFTSAAATSTGGSWLSVSPPAGSTPSSLTISVAPGSLSAGTYSGTVTVTPGGGLPVTPVPVTLTVIAGAAPALTVAPNPVTFSYQAGSSTLPAAQTVSIASSGTAVNYNAAVTTFSGGSWLSIFPISGATPGSVLLTAAPGSLAPGTYSGSLSVTSAGASNSPVVVPVTLTITASPVLSASPSALTFNFTTGGATPAAQIVSVASSGAPLNYTAAVVGASWLSVTGAGTTPGTVTVSANPAGVAAGAYNATVTLTPGGGGSPVSVPVTLNVVSSATLAPSPTSLTFNFQLAGSAPAPQTITVGSTGSPLGFSVSLTNLPWLTVTPVTGASVTTLTATANPAGLAAGNYAGTITLATGTSAPPVVVPVTLMVSSAATSLISAAPNPVIFNYLVGGPVPPPKTVSLTSAAPVAYTVTASTASWLTVLPASGTTPGTLTITATPGALAPGSYAASVSLATSGHAPLVIPVFLSITPAPGMTATPTSLAFAFQTGGTAPAAQSVTVASSGVAFTAAASVTSPWLSVTPASANSPGTFMLSANPASLLPGVYNGSVTFAAPASNSPVNVPVVLTVSAGPAISASPASLTFNFKSGGANPAPQTVALASTAGPLAFTAASDSPWLALVSPAGGTAPGTLSVTANPAGLVTGSYTGAITLTPTGGGNTITLPVEFDVNSAAVPDLKAVTNALSYALGPVAPGEIVSLWGAGLGPVAPAGILLTPSKLIGSNIGNVRVLFDGIPAVLTMASDKQVNAIVPYAVAGNSSTVVQLEYQGVKSVSLTVPIAASAPGLATFNASGTGEGAILNQDVTVNSVANPAAAGSVIVLFGTGGGQTNPPGIDGIIPGTAIFVPVLPVTATVGGVDANVWYAGAAPSLVSGVLQVNVQIPASVGPGPQPVVIKVGSAFSQAGYNVVVR